MANKQRIQLVVDALLSGEFIQGTERLTTVDSDGRHSDCCLGVACKVAARNGLDVVTTQNALEKSDREWAEIDYNGGNDPHAWNSSTLPVGISEWLGFGGDNNPVLVSRETGQLQAASAWNDDEKKTFSEIADMFAFTYIENDGPLEAKDAWNEAHPVTKE